MSVGDMLDRDEDRPAYVRFERRAVKDSEATLAAGHYKSKDEDYALITPPYSKDLVEKKVATWFKQVEANVVSGRVPEKHFHLWKETYKRWLEGQDAPVNGTSVKDWNTLSPAQCKNLIGAGCRTIEDLAQANDEAIRRIGMGAHDLKNKAKAWLQAAKDHGPLTMEVESLKKENDTLKASLDALQEQMKLMQIQLEGKNDVIGKALYETPEVIEFEKPTLAEQYQAKFGKPPHHLMKDATILKKLQE